MDLRIIERALLSQKDEFNDALAINYCSRPEEELVNLESRLAQVIIGIRRSGKSSLCFNLIKKSGIKFAYVNFDDERLSKATGDDLDGILECLYKIYGDFNHLFIDEMQNISEWYLFVNRLLRAGMHILITGSNAKLLSGELATHLTGRYMKTELYPFSFKEYCAYRGISTLHGTTKEIGILRSAFDSYLHDGGLPELINEKRKQTYINTLTDNILKKDIEKRYSIHYRTAFENIACHLLNTAPSKLNYLKIKKEFGLKSDHTAENYVSYLKNAYLLCGIKKFSFKSKMRIHDEKTYAVDVAFMNRRDNALSGDNLGWRLETIILVELQRRFKPQECDIYYYEDNSFEADFVITRGRSVLQIIQVSYDISDEKTLRREKRGLLSASKATGCSKLLLITDHEERNIDEDGKTIHIVPAYAWLTEDDTSLLSPL